MKLLYTPRSPYARKVRVAAIEKGINFRMPRLWAAAEHAGNGASREIKLFR